MRGGQKTSPLSAYKQSHEKSVDIIQMIDIHIVSVPQDPNIICNSEVVRFGPRTRA